MKVHRLRLISRNVCLFALLYLITGVGLRISNFRDGNSLTAPVFYATPLLLLALASLIIWIPRSFHVCSRTMVRLMVFFIVIGYWWQFSWYGVASEAISLDRTRPQVSVLFWNLRRTNNRASDLIKKIELHKPDLVAIVERGDDFESAISAYIETQPGYDMVVEDGKIAVLARGSIGATRYHQLAKRSRCLQVNVDVKGHQINLLVVDIGSSPFADRGEPLGLIHNLASSTSQSIVAGDFNTPYDSVHFDIWKSVLNHTFQLVGSGFIQTWPYGIPMYTLDHIWVSKDMQPVQIDKGYNFFTSDHAWLFAHLALHE